MTWLWILLGGIVGAVILFWVLRTLFANLLSLIIPILIIVSIITATIFGVWTMISYSNSTFLSEWTKILMTILSVITISIGFVVIFYVVFIGFWNNGAMKLSSILFCLTFFGGIIMIILGAIFSDNEIIHLSIPKFWMNCLVSLGIIVLSLSVPAYLVLNLTEKNKSKSWVNRNTGFVSNKIEIYETQEQDFDDIFNDDYYIVISNEQNIPIYSIEFHLNQISKIYRNILYKNGEFLDSISNYGFYVFLGSNNIEELEECNNLLKEYGIHSFIVEQDYLKSQFNQIVTEEIDNHYFVYY